MDAGTDTNGTTDIGQTDLAEMIEALDTSARRLVGLLTELDESDGDRPVPGLEWSVADTAAHMLTVLRRGTGDNRRSDTLTGLAELNDEALGEIDTRSLSQLAELIQSEAETLVTILGGLSQEQAVGLEVQLHAGLRADLPSALSYILCDLLAHGYDIAVGSGVDWPIDASRAAFDLHAMVPLLGPWVVDAVRTGPPARMAFSFPGDDIALVVEAGEGRYCARRVARADLDDVVEVDPVESFLAMSGRGDSHHPAVQQIASWFRPF